MVWVGTAIATFFTILRTWLQYSHNRCLFANDILIFLALMFHVVLSILYQFMSPPMYEVVAVGVKSQIANALFASHFVRYLRLQFAVTYMYWTSLWLVKLALLSFFWRLYESVRTNVRVFVGIMCSITIATWTISLFLQGFACSPSSNFFVPGEESPAVLILPR